MAHIAGLYRVQGPNGVYYAVFDPATGRLWTERSEHSARDQAEDAGLELAPERAITHQALMKLSGRDTHPARPQPTSSSPTPTTPPEEKPPRPAISRSPFASSDASGPVLINRSNQVSGGLFSGETPVAPPTQPTTEESETPSAGSVFSRDVLDGKSPLPRGKGKNPFADKKPKHRD
jgi:hypothetical protein